MLQLGGNAVLGHDRLHGVMHEGWYLYDAGKLSASSAVLDQDGAGGVLDVPSRRCDRPVGVQAEPAQPVSFFTPALLC